MTLPKFFCFLIICCASEVCAQQIISGRITDAETGKPVAYSTVAAPASVQTLSNETGEFDLILTALPVTLQISHLGYQSKTLTIEKQSSPVNILLTPKTFELPEARVGNPALAIIQEATKKAMENYKKTFPAKAFLRQTAYQAGKPAYLQEIWFDASWTAYGLIKWNPTESRRLDAGKGINYTNFSFSTLIFSGYLPNNLLIKPLRKNADSLYTFKLTGTTEKNGQEIARINCIPRNGIKGVRFEGDYYINTVTNDIVMIDGIIRDMKFTSSGPMSIKNRETRFLAQFHLNDQGDNVLEYTTFNLINRLKVMGFGTQDTELYNTLFFTTLPNTNPATLLDDVKPDINDQTLIRSMHTDPDFWQKNPGITRTAREQEAIKELEKTPR